MYEYVEIIAESTSLPLEEGKFLEMFVENSARKLPVIGIIKQFPKPSVEGTNIQLLIQAQTGGDIAPMSFLHEGSSLRISTGFRKIELGNAKVSRRWFEPAVQTSWKNTPIPKEDEINLEYNRVFTPKEFDRIKLGELPSSMDDHWFAYFEYNCLYWFRSWTGLGMFEVHFEASGDEVKVSRVIGNKNPEIDPRLVSVELLNNLMSGLCWHSNQIFDV